ncbi:MAG: ParB N-terminal domain-containing protein, partial [Lachnospiraceae bacterium]|nr:ParB N-terminal domain-containing protein [Lachnospiraceae bacterium]
MGIDVKTGSAARIKLVEFDDLFGRPLEQEGAEKVIYVPLAELHTFKGHPFQVRDDEKMEETAESIREYGVLVPGIARPRTGGGYEIIAGHRRKRGLELAGKTEMPVIV